MHVLVVAVFLSTQAVEVVPTVDRCTNIAGIQAAVPKGFASFEGLCFLADDVVVVEAPPAPMPTQASPKSGKKTKPKAKLTASPQLIVYTPYTVPVIRLTLTITDADDLYWCPRVVFEWPDGTLSTQEGDCVPFEEASPSDLARRTAISERSIHLPPGQWTAKASLVRADTVFDTKEIIINVTGQR